MSLEGGVNKVELARENMNTLRRLLGEEFNEMEMSDIASHMSPEDVAGEIKWLREAIEQDDTPTTRKVFIEQMRARATK